jgi:GDSL-like Lipase/Acylhydrolase family
LTDRITTLFLHPLNGYALGDSIMQAIGAAHPEDGIAGRIASYLATKTGHPVHVTNVSVGGATIREIIDQQLPQVDLNQADLIIVATATDLERRVPLDSYEADLRALLRALPPGKTILSDLPLEPGREPYQAKLEQLADERGIQRADFAKVFRNEGRRLDIGSLGIAVKATTSSRQRLNVPQPHFLPNLGSSVGTSGAG